MIKPCIQSESRSVMSDSLWPHGLYSPWNSPGQNSGVVAFPVSREFSQPWGGTQVSRIAGGFFTSWASREASVQHFNLQSILWSYKIRSCTEVGDGWAPGWTFTISQPPLCISSIKNRWAPAEEFTTSLLFALQNGSNNRNRVNSQSLSLVNISRE